MKHLKKFNEDLEPGYVLSNGSESKEGKEHNLIRSIMRSYNYIDGERVVKNYSTKEAVDALEHIFNKGNITMIWKMALESGRFDIVDELINRGHRIEDDDVRLIVDWLKHSSFTGREGSQFFVPGRYEKAMKYLQ
jgi:hypothetical protein